MCICMSLRMSTCMYRYKYKYKYKYMYMHVCTYIICVFMSRCACITTIQPPRSLNESVFIIKAPA